MGEKANEWGAYGVGIICTAVVVWLLAQILSLFASAEAMHGVGRVVAYVAAWGSVALVGVVAAWGLALLRRFPKVPQVAAGAYVGRETELRQRLMKGYLAAIVRPEEYVREAGFADEARAAVAERIGLLKRAGGIAGEAVNWLVEFKALQTIQDERAEEIVGKHMKSVAIKTAVSPWKLLDALAVFYNSAMMIFEIAKVYNRRTTKAGAVRLALRWAFNIYVAHEVGQVAESGMDMVTDAAGQFMKPHGISGAIASSLPLVGMIASKAVEGGANALFARSLGRKAIAEFRAVVF